jgi:DNA polymerase III epsilon subunit family exonuclease
VEGSDGFTSREPLPEAAGELEWVDAELEDYGTSAATRPPKSAGGPRTQTPGVARASEAVEVRDAGAAERLARRVARRRRARPLSAAAAWEERPLRTLACCVIDLETTGATHGRDDEVLEIGAVQVNGIELGREFVTLVDPRRPISGAAHRVHGIDNSQVLSAPRLQEALPWLLETIRDRVLVFHNAGFDLGFLQRAMLESDREPLTQPVLDTLVLARRALGGRCALSSLAQRLGLEAQRPHRALSDARTTAQLLVVLLALCERAGATTLGDVPALSTANQRVRGRRGARVDPLLERLESALRRGESLRISYHASAGVAPFELQIRPLRLRGGTHLDSYDELMQRHLVLDVTRIGSVRTAP